MAVTSLLKSAEATRKKLREQERAEIAYQYSQSAKTYDDFQAYTKYLDDQASHTADPSEALTIRKAVDSAQSGYISNEIQRQTIAVQQGRGTSTDKYNRMVDLYHQAQDNGNADLAQSLASQLGSLSIQIQNEFDAGQRAAKTMALNQVTTLGKLIRKMKDGDAIMRLPDGTLVKPFAMLNKEISGSGKASSSGDELGYFEDLLATARAMQQVVADAYQGATTQEAVDSIEQKYGDIIQGTAGLIKAAGKGSDLTLNDFALAVGSAQAGNPLYSITTGRDESSGATTYSLQKNKVDDFVWSYNPDGTVSGVETRAKVADPAQSLNASLNPDGKLLVDGQYGYNKAETIKNKLANQGYSAEDNGDGTFKIVDPQGVIYQQATVMPDGSVRFFGEPGQYSGGQSGLYELDINSGQKREVAPDETSIFGTQGNFGMVSSPTDAGLRISKSLVSPAYTKAISPDLSINPVADVSGRSIPLGGSALQGGSNVPQFTNTQNQLQPAYAANLNQTPVPQTAQNGAPIRQLQVVKPAPTPTVSVQPVAPTPNVVVAPTPQTPKVVVAPTPQTPKVVIAR